MKEPCKEDLLQHSTLDHGELRKLMEDGRCPICDPTVPREEYQRVVYTITISPEIRKRVIKGG